MANVPREVDQQNVEAVVYFVVSPDSGPGHRIYSDEDIHALGGIHTIERILENESYWYVRLGQIRGKSSPLGLTFQNSEFAGLPHPTEMACQIGRRNPGFRNSEVERHIFKAAFLTIGRILDTWKREEDGMIEAFTLKELKISPQRLVCLASSLQTLERIHENCRHHRDQVLVRRNVARTTVSRLGASRVFPENSAPASTVHPPEDARRQGSALGIMLTIRSASAQV